MAVTMDKELLVRMPSALYTKVKTVCEGEYKSISALVRELLLEKVEECLDDDEIKLASKASKDFHKGKGTSWRKVRRG